MNIELSKDDTAFRQEVRDFLADHLTPELRSGQLGTSGSYPHPDVGIPWQRALQSRGWLVPLWPEAWGGTGWSGLRRFIFENECALAGAPLVHPMGVRYVGPVIIRFGSEAQKREYLPRILSSEDYWCQGFSEPDAGSDLASLSLRAVREGDHYLLNGTKIWTTNAQFANRMFALVRTSREVRRQDGISFVLVDMQSPGITVRPIATMGGDHDVNEVFFDNVRVPCTQLVGQEGAGWECAKYLLEFERGAGIFSPRLRSHLKRVGLVLTGRENAPLALRTRFAEIAADLDAFEWLELRTLAPLKPGQNPGPASSILKLRSSRLKQDIAQLGMEALDGSGLRWRGTSDLQTTESDGSPVSEYLNSRAYTIFGGSAEIQLSLIAGSLLA